jgi:hypothetical protein
LLGLQKFTTETTLKGNARFLNGNNIEVSRGAKGCFPLQRIGWIKLRVPRQSFEFGVVGFPPFDKGAQL